MIDTCYFSFNAAVQGEKVTNPCLKHVCVCKMIYFLRNINYNHNT